jgi:glutamate racemase
MKIGVFDSGIGGKAIANSLASDFPDAIIKYVNDTKHVPYGAREESEIITLTEQAIRPL